MRPRRLISCALCAVALASVPGTALADPTRQEWAEWKQLVESGKKAMREGRPKDAVTALQRAEGIHKSPSVEVDLATALTAAGKLVEARKVLTRVAESTDQGVIWKRARDAAKKALADLSPRVPSLRIAVSGAPGAAVSVDGEKVTTDADVAVDPGDHTVRATADGFREVERTVSLAAGKRESITLEMVAAAPSGAATASEQRGSRVPGIVLLSIGGAALAAGGVLGGLAFSAVGSAKAACAGTDCPPSAAADIDRSKLFGNASTGLFIGGGVVAAVGIVLTIVAPGGKKADPPKDSAAITPFVGPGTVGVAGRF